MNNSSGDKFFTFLKKYITLKLILIFIALLGIGTFLIVISFEKYSETELWYWYLLREVGKTFIITGFISTVIKSITNRQVSLLSEEKEKFEKEREEKYQEEVKRLLEDVKVDILNISNSYDSLNQLGIEKIYSNRNDAANDIHDSLLNAENIKIVGISLNDYVRDERSTLYQTWQNIQDIIDKKVIVNDERDKKLIVKILMIDRNSNGAFVRGQSEGLEDNNTRILTDTKEAMEHFLDVQSRCNSNQHCDFQTKIYNCTPISHLIITDNTIYMESYYFRKRHADRISPVLKIRFNESSNSLYQELIYHFDCMWESNLLTTDIDKYYNQFCHGSEEALRNASIINSFYDTKKSRKRIINMLNRAEKIIWIKGISLHSFFSYGSDIYWALINKIQNNPDIDVRVLIVDPDSEESKKRSFREYLITKPDSMFNDFNETARKRARLYSDTKNTINFISQNLFIEKDLSNFVDNIKLYNSSIDCFMLITENSCLIEQYHYGKNTARDGENQKYRGLILGGEVPVFEYMNNSIDSPYKLYKDSFDYVYNHCSEELKRKANNYI